MSRLNLTTILWTLLCVTTANAADDQFHDSPMWLNSSAIQLTSWAGDDIGLKSAQLLEPPALASSGIGGMRDPERPHRSYVDDLATLETPWIHYGYLAGLRAGVDTGKG